MLFGSPLDKQCNALISSVLFHTSVFVVVFFCSAGTEVLISFPLFWTNGAQETNRRGTGEPGAEETGAE